MKEVSEALKKLAETIVEAFREFWKNLRKIVDSVQRTVTSWMLSQKKTQQVPMWANDPTKTRRNRNR